MSLSNDRREVLRKRINKQKGWAAARSGMSADELRALLDMADERDSLEEDRDDWVGEYNYQMHRYDALFDEAEKIRIERDRYRALLEEVHGTWKNGRLAEVNQVIMDRIDAALEGKE